MEAVEFLRLRRRLPRVPKVGDLESCFAISGWQWATFPVGFFASPLSEVRVEATRLGSVC